MADLKEDKNKFELGVIFFNFGLALTLIIMSLINADMSFINIQPLVFIREALLVGVVSFLTTSMITYNRGANLNKILNASFIAFFIFFIFHILMELSGLNNSTIFKINNLNKDVQETLNDTILNPKIILPVLLLSGAIMWTLVYRIQDFGQYRRKGLKNSSLECLLFGMVNATPTYIISKNRGANNNLAIKNAGLMSITYSIMYILLEGGGIFTKNIYKK